MNLLTLWAYSYWKNSMLGTILSYVVVSARKTYLCCSAASMGLRGRRVGLNLSLTCYSITSHFTLRSSVKTSHYRFNYNPQELNLICEYPQLCSRPGPHRRSVCVVPKQGRCFHPEIHTEGKEGEEMKLNLSPCCLIK